MAQARPTDGRGHNADRPTDILKRGLAEHSQKSLHFDHNKNVSVVAAGVAFYGILSLFLALAVLVAIYGLFADPATVQHQINTIGGLIPSEAQKLIADYLKSIASSKLFETWHQPDSQPSDCFMERQSWYGHPHRDTQYHLRRVGKAEYARIRGRGVGDDRGGHSVCARRSVADRCGSRHCPVSVCSVKA